MEWYLLALNKYSTFTGRASRREYWMFVLVNFLIAFTIGFIGGLFKSKAIVGLGNLYQLGVLVPSVAVGVRRMHDIGKSGWYLLIPFYNFVLLATPGEVGSNMHGPDPKQDDIVVTPIRPNTLSADEQIEKLAHLKMKGYITEAEFEARKKHLKAS